MHDPGRLVTHEVTRHNANDPSSPAAAPSPPRVGTGLGNALDVQGGFLSITQEQRHRDQAAEEIKVPWPGSQPLPKYLILSLAPAPRSKITAQNTETGREGQGGPLLDANSSYPTHRWTGRRTAQKRGLVNWALKTQAGLCQEKKMGGRGGGSWPWTQPVQRPGRKPSAARLT